MLATRLARYADDLKLIDKMDEVSRSIVINGACAAMREAALKIGTPLENLKGTGVVEIAVPPQKSCATCKHEFLGFAASPCRGCCGPASLPWSEWEPK